MGTLQILVSGDYWHEDFREHLATLEVPATMVRLEQINSLSIDDFELIVLAQSRRNQIAQESVDALRAQNPDIPIIVLLGSWCEGENRSGKPLVGVNLVPWQQWKSRFGDYCRHIVEGVTPDWCQPLTATVADRVRDFTPDPEIQNSLLGKKVLVSSDDKVTFDTIADMLRVYQCTSLWAESEEESLESEVPNAICIDGNGATQEFRQRVGDLSEKFGDLPVVALLGFPRKQDVESLSTLRVQEVVSKPYSHLELVSSLARATEQSVPAV